MSNPDWGRVGVVPPDHHLSALGDATRWGATVVQHMPAIDGVSFQGGTLTADQVLSASCRDAYPRVWSLYGTLSAPPFAWTLGNGAGPELFGCQVVVTMGLGQSQLVHAFNIRAVINADSPFYYITDGFNALFSNVAFGPSETHPFIIPGALVGNKVNMKVTNTLLTATPMAAFDFITTLMIVPYAPGVEAPK